MSIYYEGSDGHIKKLGDNYLEHGHKYLLKIGDGKNARYFYTQAEVDAFKKIKSGIKNEIEGVKRFINRDDKSMAYLPDGKTYADLKYNKKKKVYEFGKKKKTARIERGMLKVYRILHPYE